MAGGPASKVRKILRGSVKNVGPEPSSSDGFRSDAERGVEELEERLRGGRRAEPNARHVRGAERGSNGAFGAGGGRHIDGDRLVGGRCLNGGRLIGQDR